MKRLKERWDEIHPGYSFLSDKNLRDQASRIEKNKDVMDTEYVHVRSNNNSEADEQTDYSNNCSETVNNSHSGSYEESQPTLEPLTVIQQECFQSIKPLFERNCVTINRQPINERTFCTKIMKHPSDDVLKVIDQLAKRKLSQIENPNYLDINVLLYTAAVTTKEYLNDLRENYTEKSSKAKVPQWITNIEAKILRLRRTIGHLTTNINCKKTGIFTNHQKNLKERYYKKYGNILCLNITYVLHPQNSSTKRKGTTVNLLIERFRPIQKPFTVISKVTIFQQKNYQQKKVLERNLPKNYDINLQLVNQIISKIQLQKSPGSDLINSFWYKRLSFCREKLTELYQHTYRGNLCIKSTLVA